MTREKERLNKRKEDLYRDNKKVFNDNYELDEQSFYPPSDNRTWKSNVRDINGGDNFADYCEYIFELLDEEDYYEN